MAIDPTVLAKQREALSPSTLRLVPPQPPRCECGSCRRCKNRNRMREHMRALRTGQREIGDRPGYRLDASRLCARCGGRIAEINKRQVCWPCQGGHRSQGREHFIDGGGI